MSQVSPYKLFWDWCFDRKPKSPIPNPEVLLKYNSPINTTFLLKSFVQHAKLNHYLNEYLNNIGIYYIDKEELFFFIKRCIQDFKVKKKDIHFIKYKRQEILIEKLKQKCPTLKIYDIGLLAKVIQKSKDKNAIYSALGLEKPKKQKLKKWDKLEKVSLSSFLKENFKMVKVLQRDYKL